VAGDPRGWSRQGRGKRQKLYETVGGSVVAPFPKHTHILILGVGGDDLIWTKDFAKVINKKTLRFRDHLGLSEGPQVQYQVSFEERGRGRVQIDQKRQAERRRHGKTQREMGP
jgi:hypothetical protein